MLDKIGKPVDRTEWGMSTPTVNAYYNPSINEIVLLDDYNFPKLTFFKLVIFFVLFFKGICGVSEFIKTKPSVNPVAVW